MFSVPDNNKRKKLVLPKQVSRVLQFIKEKQKTYEIPQLQDMI
jgi:hypothetical protein